MTATIEPEVLAGSCDPDCWECHLGTCGAAPVSPVVEPSRPVVVRPATPALVVGTRRTSTGMYIGVLRCNRRVVAECGHTHRNRDMHTTTNGASARNCIGDILRAASDPRFAAELVARTRDGWLALQRGPWQVTAAQIERHKAAAEDDVVILERLLTTVRNLINHRLKETT